MKKNSRSEFLKSEIRNPKSEIEKSVAFLWDESTLWGVMAYKALRNMNLPFDLVRSEDIQSGTLKNYSMLFVPGGWASNKKKALGDKGAEAIREFVKTGGSYLGFCGGAGLATLDGIGLLDLKRKPTKERVPSFSGRICLNVNEHPMWLTQGQGARGKGQDKENSQFKIQNSKDLSLVTCHSSLIFHAWWPSQFLIDESGIKVLATYGKALPDSFSSDLNTGDIEANGNWEELEKVYGINLDPKRLRDEPAVVEGCYGRGKVILSLVHFDTPDDINGPQVLRNLWKYLLKSEVGSRKSEVLKSEIRNPKSEIVNSKLQTLTSELSELETAAAGLISFGERNFLWFRRNSMLMQWRRGVRGLEYCTLYIMIREITEILETQNTEHRTQNTGNKLRKVEELLIPFIVKAKRLLILERQAMQKGHITYERCDDPEIRKIRTELFGDAKSHGGMFKELIDEIDNFLFLLLT
ncbi:MAG: hypothetical protein C4526_10915 [Nitrospiraceae bacterium]|nr:MAG: hypothetical protein C4526_10915 [Nitrospiraceae bacterium]